MGRGTRPGVAASTTFVAAMATLVAATAMSDGDGPPTGTVADSQASGPAPQAGGADPTVIMGATVIDGTGATPRPDTTVLIVGDRIAAVGDVDEINVPPGSRTIDGAGKFLIPGLWDTHAHLSYWGEDALEMLVSAGVTSIRELGGDLEEIETWKGEIAEGARLGPSMIWCGPFLEGPEGDEAYRVFVSSSDEARYAARALQARGVDFLKIQPRIDRAVVEALIDEAADLGLSVVGHLPVGVGPIEGAEMGLRSIEHMSPYLRLDDAELDNVFAAYRDHGTWMSPALYSMVAPIEARREDPDADSRVRRAHEIVRRAHAAGVPLLVGSNFAYRDWPQRPGTGLHGEMRAFVAAGVPPIDVIHLATQRAAEFAGLNDEVGAVQPGLRADLVLLDADPLADIANVGRIDRVFLHGRAVVDQGRVDAAPRARR